MELVYLWVENYKNIEKQGFNFSPRFKCEFKPEYDENNNLKDNCELIIKENKDYINIFPENINITAIVGENGSGKSSLFEILTSRCYKDDKKLFLIFFDKSNKNKLLLNGAETKNKEDFIELKEDNNTFEILVSFIIIPSFLMNNESRIIYFNNLLTKNDLLPPIIYENIIGKGYSVDNHINYMSNISTTQLLIEATNKQEHITNFNKIYYSYMSKEIEKVFTLMKKSSLELDILRFNLPKNLVINNVNFGDLIKKELKKIKDLKEKKLEKIYLHKTLKIIKNRNKILFKNYLKFNLIILFILKLKNEKRYSIIEKLDKKYTSIENFYDSVKKIVVEIDYRGFFKDTDELIKKIEEIDTNNNLNSNNYEIKLDIKKVIDSSFFDIYNKLTQKFEYFLDFGWDGLSNGEETFLYQFSRIYHYINFDIANNKNIFLLIDEGEVTLHPQWQKSYINFLIDFLNKNFANDNSYYSKNIHIILTSHSPFILSDLPKENVIFLKKDEKTENCINVTEEMKDLKTFGANIHTLLSHGFFMQDGLMGEFAKSKIEEIKKFYDENKDLKKDDSNFINKKEEFEKNKKDFYYIQSIIGEPFLQKIIKNYLDELEQIFDDEDYKDRKKEELLKQFSKEEIEKYLESFNNAKN